MVIIIIISIGNKGPARLYDTPFAHEFVIESLPTQKPVSYGFLHM